MTPLPTGMDIQKQIKRYRTSAGSADLSALPEFGECKRYKREKERVSGDSESVGLSAHFTGSGLSAHILSGAESDGLLSGRRRDAVFLLHRFD